jgi:hypothetical protein
MCTMAAVLVATAAPAAVQAQRVPTTHTGAVSPRAMYTEALHRLSSVARLQFVETVEIQQPNPRTIHLAFRYVAPDRMAAALVAKHGTASPVVIETLQVGTTKCQRPPSWVCFHSIRTDVGALVRSLLTPQVAGLRYRSGTAMIGSGARRYRAIKIALGAEQQGASYRAMLTMNAATRLPLTFTSTVTRSGQAAVRQSVSFTYGGRFTIRLPQGVHLPPR